MQGTPPSAGASDLPVHLTGFIGRDDELESLTRLVPAARLVTLTGAGGSGKTRLARETAVRVAASFERIAWADLGGVSDGDLMAQQIAGALHLAERAGVHPRERIVGAICDAPTLLVLDNCEHLVDECAELAEALLRGCPRLTVLATSREALGVPGETAWLVPPLVPAEAIRLFVDRTQAAVPGFTIGEGNADAISEICRRLDGMPLAIELAAARMRVLSAAQIAQRLDDVFRLLTTGSRTALPRHRTLRATMEWSFGLLGTREQVLLRRLSVFAGEFTLDAAEAICAGDPLDSDDILDGVAALVDKSLVAMTRAEGCAQYRLLEVVRQYGREQLRASGDADRLEERHAAYYLAIVEAAAPRLHGGESEPGILAALAADHDNIRAACAWAVRGDGHAEVALRFCAGLFWYWYGATMGAGAGLFREGRRLISDALGLPGADVDPAHRGRALLSRGLIALAQGTYDEADEALVESLVLMRTHGTADEVTLVVSKLGAVRMMQGRLAEAQELADEAHARLGDRPPETMLHSFVYSWRGYTARLRGDFAMATAMHELNLVTGRRLNHRTILGHGFAMLAAVDLAAGREDDAFAHYCEALPYHLDLGDGWGLALDLEGLAACAALRGRHADAARLLGAVDALREKSAVALPATETVDRERRVAMARERLGEEFDALYTTGRALPMEDVVRLATDASVLHTAEHRVVVSAPAAGAPATGGLRVLGLGSLQVFIGDRAIETVEWGSARPRELLVYLLMHPDGRTREQVGLAFWPDASAAQIRNNFHVTMHRLRKTLGGAEWVALQGDRYRIDPARITSVDFVAFEHDVVAGRRALQDDATAVAAARLERALTRYRGDLLDGEPVGDWHLEHRDRLQRLYTEALMALGRWYGSDDRPAKAAEAYRTLLAREPLHEEALRGLMHSLALIGDRAQALRAYQRFESRLREEFEAVPAVETVALFGQLQSTSVSP